MPGISACCSSSSSLEEEHLQNASTDIHGGRHSSNKHRPEETYRMPPLSMSARRHTQDATAANHSSDVNSRIVRHSSSPSPFLFTGSEAGWAPSSSPSSSVLLDGRSSFYSHHQHLCLDSGAFSFLHVTVTSFSILLSWCLTTSVLFLIHMALKLSNF